MYSHKHFEWIKDQNALFKLKNSDFRYNEYYGCYSQRDTLPHFNVTCYGGVLQLI